MGTFGTIAIELLVGFSALFVFTKLAGKTHFSQITPFDFISALILGELLGNAVYAPEVTIYQVLFATSLWAMLIISTISLTQKFKKMRKTLEGEPAILIRKGQLKYKTMKKNRIDINQVQSLIRQEGYFSLQEIQYAILESNGMLSVLPKSDYDVPKKRDLQIPPEEVNLPVTLILDGQLVQDNFTEAGVDVQWLKDELAAQNIHSFREVLYAEWNKSQPLFVNVYDQK